MSLIISEWTRRDTAGRVSFGRAVVNDCQLLRSRTGVRDSWFYWVDEDTVGIVAAAESGVLVPELGQDAEEVSVTSGLSTLAERISIESWGVVSAQARRRRS